MFYQQSSLRSATFNIQFIKGRAALLGEHGGDWRNPTSGPLLDRLSQLSGLSGPALLVFFLTFEQKMKEFAKESPLISDPDSWESYINPWNYLVESIAWLEAIAAADQAQRQSEQNNRQGAQSNTPGFRLGGGYQINIK